MSKEVILDDDIKVILPDGDLDEFTKVVVITKDEPEKTVIFGTLVAMTNGEILDHI